jgi:transketolase N-terminal domain/subunit
VTRFNNLERRIVELSYQHQLTHVSSCLNTVNLLDWIYVQRKPDDPVILGNSHAALALYVVLERNGKCNAEEMIKKHGTHAGRDMEHGIWVSGGALGQPETVAVGMALADKNRKVWLVTSDGSCMEGATMEAVRVASHYCPNLNIFVVFNGYGAYGRISHGDLPMESGVKIHYVDATRYPEFLRGLAGHYLVLNNEQYSELMS